MNSKLISSSISSGLVDGAVTNDVSFISFITEELCNHNERGQLTAAQLEAFAAMNQGQTGPVGDVYSALKISFETFQREAEIVSGFCGWQIRRPSLQAVATGEQP